MDILQELKDIMKTYVGEDVDMDAVQLDSNLMENFQVDSVDLVEIVLDIEEKFDIQIEDELFEKMTTPGAIVDIIKSKMS